MTYDLITAEAQPNVTPVSWPNAGPIDAVREGRLTYNVYSALQKLARPLVITSSIGLALKGGTSTEAPETRTNPIAWKWLTVTGDGTLHSSAAEDTPTPWLTRTLTARCNQRAHADRDLIDCDCGVFGCLNLADVEQRAAPESVITRIQLHGRVWTTADNCDPSSTRRAQSATLLGPLHVPPWLSDIAEPLHSRYRLPVVIWHRGRNA